MRAMNAPISPLSAGLSAPLSANVPTTPTAAARMAQIESFYAMEIMREATALEAAGRSIITSASASRISSHRQR